MQWYTFISLYNRNYVLLPVETDFTNYHLPLWEWALVTMFCYIALTSWCFRAGWPQESVLFWVLGSACHGFSRPSHITRLPAVTLLWHQPFFFFFGRLSHIYTSATNLGRFYNHAVGLLRIMERKTACKWGSYQYMDFMTFLKAFLLFYFPVLYQVLISNNAKVSDNFSTRIQILIFKNMGKNICLMQRFLSEKLTLVLRSSSEFKLSF